MTHIGDVLPAAMTAAPKVEPDRTSPKFRQRVRESLLALKIPPRYADATLDGLQLYGSPAQRTATTRAVRIARRLVGEYPEWGTPLVAFLGGPGTGKGHAAWAIARWAAEQYGDRVRFVELGAMIRDLRAAWSDRDLDERKILRGYQTLDLLIVNDVSTHAFRGEPMQHLFDVLEERLNFLRPTILTTNEDDVGLRGILGPALWDRLTGFDGGLVDFGRESYRQTSSAERAA